MDKLQNLRNNIIKWYNFDKNSKILYLTTDDDLTIPEYLGTICKELVIVKFVSNGIKETNNGDNTDRIVDKFKNVSINKKFDYVILLGTLNYANEIIEGENPEIQLLEFCKSMLEENGTILMAIENRIGVKYLVGDKSNHCKNIYDSIKNKFEIGKMYSQSEIQSIINKCEFKYQKNYYPLPDYKYANVIYTDKMLPKKNDSKINYNVMYEEGSLVLQNEIELLKQFINEGEFTQHTNSYLIELSNMPIKNDVKFISYNNMRKEEFSLILILHNDIVEKRINNEISRYAYEKYKILLQKIKRIRL